MKKNFFAKIGHFTLVATLLFNSFGVAFVHADVVVDPTTVSFVHANYPVPELTLPDGGEWSTGIAAIRYTGPALAEGETVSITISVDTTNSTAIQDKDFKFTEVTSSFTSSISKIELPITIISNNLVESDRTIVLKNNLSSSTFTLTIQDDDIADPPTFDETFNPSPFKRAENASLGGTAAFINNSNTTLDFHFVISGTASASDYVIGTTSHSIPAVGEATFIENSVDLTNGIIHDVVGGEKRRFEFQPVDDTEVEGDEEVIITLTYATDSAGKVYDFADISYTTIILDNDTVTSISNFGFETSSSTVVEGDEGNKTVVIRLVADQIQTQDRILNINIEDSSTAKNDYPTSVGGDFIRSVNTSNQASLTMASGTDYAELEITIEGDTTFETNETIVLSAGSANYDDFKMDTTSNTHVLTIQNDDVDESGETVIKNKVSFDSSSESIDEGYGTYSIKVHSITKAKNSGAGGPEGTDGILVYFQVDPSSTLSADVDYTIDAATTTNGYYAVIPVGSTSTNIHVNIVNDSDVESTENLSLIITGVGPIDTTVVDESADTFLLIVNDNDTISPTENSGSNGSGSSGGTYISNTHPTAAFTTGQEVTIAVNTEVTFDASASSDSEGNIQFYFWTFGDGSDEVYYTSPTVTHTYTQVGTYSLTAKVKDTFGAENTATILVHVVAGNDTPAETENTNNSSTTNTGTTTPTTDNTQTGSTPEETTGATTPPTQTNTPEPTTLPTENNTVPEEQTTTNEQQNSGTNNQGEAPTQVQPTEENQGLPTWIKILFGSGAVVTVAGAGIAVNRARRTL